MDKPFDTNAATTNSSGSPSILGMELIMNPRKRSPSDVASTTSSAALSQASFRRRDTGPITNRDTTVRHNEHARSPSISSRASSISSHDGRDHRRETGRQDAEDNDSDTSGSTRSSGSEGNEYEGSTASSEGIQRRSKTTGHSRDHARAHLYDDRQHAARMSGSEELDAKQNLLHQFSRLEKRGVTLPRRFTLASSLSEMQAEFQNLKKDRQTDVSVAWQRKMLMVCVSGIEMLNNKFDPFDVKLRGWSESMHDGVDDYDDIFEELSEKYSGKSTTAPELRLLFGVGGSMLMFHMTQSLCKTMPGLETVLKNNPALMQQVSQAMLSSMKGQSAPESTNTTNSSTGGGMLSFLGSMFSPPPASTRDTPASTQQMRPTQPNKPTPMRGPSQVDDLLRDLHATAFSEPTQIPSRAQVSKTIDGSSRIEVLSNASDSDFSDIPDDVSLSHFVPPPTSARIARAPPSVQPPKVTRPRARRVTSIQDVV